MDEQKKRKKPAAVYEPGELEKTRKNLGVSDPEEARRIAKVLGGEVGVEKPPSDEETAAMRKRMSRREGYLKKGSVPVREASAPSEPVRRSPASSAGPSVSKKNASSLPVLSAKTRAAMEKLMCSKKYRIKPNYGIFSFFMGFGEHSERVSAEFIQVTLGRYVDHVRKFVAAGKKILGSADESFREKVWQNKGVPYRVFHVIENWDVHNTGEFLNVLQASPKDATITRMIPLVKTIYAPVLRLYYLGEKNLVYALKSAYKEISGSLAAGGREKVLELTKDAAGEWYYIEHQVVPGLYPLLMRMSCAECVPLEEFFTKKTVKIFPFLGLNKFDIVLPRPKTEKPAVSEEIAVPGAVLPETGKLPDTVQKGLAFLDRLFPDSGWKALDTYPDLYPYFQPLFSFKEGFGLLAPDNPMQVTVVLMRIIEDICAACRSMYFTVGDECGVSLDDDSVQEILSDWPLYREEVFEKKYVPALKEFADKIYTQGDFEKTPYGQRLLSDLMWLAKTWFFPHLVFHIIVIDKPENDISLKLFPGRVRRLKTILKYITEYTADALKQNADGHGLGQVAGLGNPWAPYVFPVPGSLSRRLDIVLGSKGSLGKTNANLLYHLLLVVCVLDWWINDAAAPAYRDTPAFLFRTASDENHTPVFSVPVRDDLNEVFVTRVKSETQKRTKD